jgi:long-chain acyl-CoA synthetase
MPSQAALTDNIFLWQKAFPDVAHWSPPLYRGTLGDMLSDCAKRAPEAMALEFRDTKLTYAEFNAKVDQLAAGLLASGVMPGEAVALFLPNTLLHPIAFFAIARMGGKIVLLSPLDAVRELQHKLEKSKAKQVISLNQQAFLPRALALLETADIEHLWIANDADYPPSPHTLMDIPEHPKVKPLGELMTASVPLSFPRVDPDDIALLQFTGGTTGQPNAATLSHAHLKAAVQSSKHWIEGAPKVRGHEIVIAALPLFHIYAIYSVMLRNISECNHLLLHERFNPEDILSDIDTKRATEFAGVPTMWIALISHPKAQTTDFSSLNLGLNGGAPIPNEVMVTLKSLMNCHMLSGWGMTETAAVGTLMPTNVEFKTGMIGIPMPGVELKIVDLEDPSRALDMGEIGEIAIRAPNLMSGYFGNPEATLKSFCEGFFLTGDIGYMDEQGIFYIVDRLKNMILCGGYNVYPAVIEAAIYEHPLVKETIVIGIDDAYRGQAAKAFITLKDGAIPFSLEDLQTFLSDRIGRHEIPKALEFREALPKSPVGKLLPRVLMDEERARKTQSQNA